MDNNSANGADPKAKYQNQRYDNQISTVGKIQVCFGKCPNADRGDHTEQDNLDTAFYRTGDRLKHRSEFAK